LKITTSTGLLGFLLAMSALSLPAAQATPERSAEKSPASIEGRLQRIAAAIQQREAQLQNPEQPETNLLLARGFADGSRGGSWNQYARGGTATGAGGGAFANAHPAYRGGAWRDGGGFANGSYGGAAFRNGAYSGGAFRNGASGGGAFRNW
jgi:rSAM-associated Gly-rich repeat protein